MEINVSLEFKYFLLMRLLFISRITIFGTSAKWLALLEEKNVKPGKKCFFVFIFL